MDGFSDGCKLGFSETDGDLLGIDVGDTDNKSLGDTDDETLGLLLGNTDGEAVCL